MKKINRMDLESHLQNLPLLIKQLKVRLMMEVLFSQLVILKQVKIKNSNVDLLIWLSQEKSLYKYSLMQNGRKNCMPIIQSLEYYVISKILVLISFWKVEIDLNTHVMISSLKKLQFHVTRL